MLTVSSTMIDLANALPSAYLMAAPDGLHSALIIPGQGIVFNGEVKVPKRFGDKSHPTSSLFYVSMGGLLLMVSTLQRSKGKRNVTLENPVCPIQPLLNEGFRFDIMRPAKVHLYRTTVSRLDFNMIKRNEERALVGVTLNLGFLGVIAMTDWPAIDHRPDNKDLTIVDDAKLWTGMFPRDQFDFSGEHRLPIRLVETMRQLKANPQL